MTPSMEVSRLYATFDKCITTIDSHTEGETTRLIIDGVGEIPGNSMMEKREYFKSNYDNVRCLLTREPRGTEILAAMVTEKVSPDAKFGLIYMDAKRYPYLCGHATIGAVETLARTGFLELREKENRVLVDTPSGIMDAWINVREGQVISVAINMVPSFVFATNQKIHVQGFGDIPLDIVCTGGFFAMVESARIGIEPIIENKDLLVELGMKIIDAANEQLEVRHPVRTDVNTVDVTEFYDSKVTDGKAMGSGVVVYGESHMDRSPCGTGTAAKLTLLHHHRKISMNQPYTNFSPLGTSFEASLVEKTAIGSVDAFVAQIQGRAWMTGIHHFLLDERDPFQQGFIV